MISPIFLANVGNIVAKSFTDRCTIYHITHAASTTVDNDGGMETSTASTGFDGGTPNVPCELNDQITGPADEHTLDGVSYQKMRQTLYVPVGTMLYLTDEIETDAGTPRNTRQIHRYRVLDIMTESKQVSIAVLLERINPGADGPSS